MLSSMLYTVFCFFSSCCLAGTGSRVLPSEKVFDFGGFTFAYILSSYRLSSAPPAVSSSAALPWPSSTLVTLISSATSRLKCQPSKTAFLALGSWFHGRIPINVMRYEATTFMVNLLDIEMPPRGRSQPGASYNWLTAEPYIASQ